MLQPLVWSARRAKDETMIEHRPYLCLLALATFLSGCASAGDKYPSLAIRDAERVSGTFEAEADMAAPVERVPASTDLIARLGQLRADAVKAHGAFMQAAPRATGLVNSARGSGVASDSWAIAQVALADLDSKRSQAAVPLGDLDLIYTDAAISFETREEISATRADVIALVSELDAVLNRLRARLPT